MSNTYLVNKPAGAAQVFLIVALVLFALAAIANWAMPVRAAPPHYVAGVLMSAGLFFFALAFMVTT